MAKTRAIIFLLLVLAVGVSACGILVWRNSGGGELAVRTGDSLRVATYNVHYIVTFKESGSWSMADWERRKGPLDEAFKHLGADIVALQESESFAGGNYNQTNHVMEWLLANNPGYAAAAVGDAREFPSTQPILYRTDRLESLDQGWFFFSETPDVIYSPTFNGSWSAFASWASLEDRETGGRFRLVNIHTDYSSRGNRRRSFELVAERIGPWVEAGENVLVVGDMNVRLGSDAIAIIEGAGVEFAPVSGATYHFNRGLNLFGAIDHVGWSGGFSMLGEPVVVRRRFSGEWPTDHYPVVVDLRLDGKG